VKIGSFQGADLVRQTSSLTPTSDDSSQVVDLAFVIVDVDLIVDPER
jgi:hypothetical protein